MSPTGFLPCRPIRSPTSPPNYLPGDRVRSPNGKWTERDVAGEDFAIDCYKVRDRSWRDGRTVRVKYGTRITKRDSELLIPLRHELSMEDVEGKTYRMTGEIISSVPWNGWSNHVCHLAQAKWTMDDGLVGYGESQDGQWNDYVYLMS